MYSCVDPSYRVLTDNDIRDLLMEQPAMFMYSNLDPWQCTIFPRNSEDVCMTRTDKTKWHLILLKRI